MDSFDCLQMNRTQKNKATSNHLGLLKARLAKLRRELITPKGGGGGTGEGLTSFVFLLFVVVLVLNLGRLNTFRPATLL